MKKLKLAYTSQKGRAKKRNIDFLLTFEQWLNWWQATGHLHERGKNKGQYCMARFNDTGSYILGNIKCITIGDNTREAHLGKKLSEETKQKISKPRKKYLTTKEILLKLLLLK